MAWDVLSRDVLSYIPIKDTSVCGHHLKLRFEVNHDILLLILAPGYTVTI